MHKGQNKKVLMFERFIVSYIIVLLIPMIIGSIVYNEALRIITDHSIESSAFMLEKSKIIIENFLDNVRKKVTGMCLNNKLRNLMYLEKQDYGSSDVLLFKEVQRELRSFDMSGAFEADYYVVLNNSDAVIGRDAIYMDIEQFYKNFFYYDVLDFEEWKKNYIDVYHENVLLSEMTVVTQSIRGVSREPCLTYIQSIPIGFKNHVCGSIIVTIKTVEIKNLLRDIGKSEDGWVYIADSSGRIITSSKEISCIPELDYNDIYSNEKSMKGFFRKDIAGSNMLVVYNRSSLNDWAYISILPSAVVLEKGKRVVTLIITITFATLLLGSVIAVLAARINLKPFKDTMELLRKFFKNEAEHNGNDYEFIRNGVARLINRNEEMRTAMDKQTMMMWSSYLGRLLSGDFSSEEEMTALAKHMGFPADGEIMAVMIIGITNSLTMEGNSLFYNDIEMMVIEKVLKKLAPIPVYTYFVDNSSKAVITVFDSKDKNYFREIIEKLVKNLSNELSTQYGISAYYAIGGFYDKLIDIQYSFNEAKMSMNRLKEGKNEYIMWYDKTDVLSSYYFPVELEQQLVNMSKAGDIDGINKILDLVYEENFANRTLMKHMVNSLYFDMRGTIIKILGDNYSSIIEDLRNIQYENLDNKDVFNMFREAYKGICEEINLKKKSHNSKLIDAIKDYIQVNYFLPELSALSIADKFGISESYFSQFFKEQTGENFSNYLKRIRIESACEMMKNGNITINEISEKVGYSSPYSFRRAFKSIIGLTPSEYRGIVT